MAATRPRPRTSYARSTHARPLPRRRATVDPDRAASDVRRTVAAVASALLPGLGQVINGRRRLGRWLAIPAVAVVAIALLLVATQSAPRLVASLMSPTAITLLLAANLVALGWRLLAVAQAFFDRRYTTPPGRASGVALAVLVLGVAAPHLVLTSWGTAAQATLDKVFVSSDEDRRPVSAVLGASGRERRLNVLLVGTDSTPARPATLTDTMIVASIDPVGNSVTMVSIPRDTINVPLGNGDVFGPKLNSLMGYAERHPDEFPQGPKRALMDATGALLGIRVHHYVKVDFGGFVKLVDAVGGVDVNVKQGFDDPSYSGRGIPDGKRGWKVEAGRQHFAGWEALAYARARKALGESDFTRAARQQEIIVALKDRILDGGSVVANLPALLDAVGDLVETDVPRDQLPTLATLADELGDARIVRVVLTRPLVKGAIDPAYGSVQVPNLRKILVVARGLFPAPGEPVVPWQPAP